MDTLLFSPSCIMSTRNDLGRYIPTIKQLSSLSAIQVKERLDVRESIAIHWEDYEEPLTEGCPHDPSAPSPDTTRKVLFAQAGCNDGDPWVLLIERTDGDYVYMNAWCDYTGFGCKQDTIVGRAATFADMWNLRMDTQGRSLVAKDLGYL
jgi:hypothetical protein